MHFLDTSLSQRVTGVVIRGHGVASGRNGDPRFPGGTLAMQAPFFRERGLDLADFHPATLNVSIAPLRYEMIAPRLTFRAVAWHPTEPAEDFSFFDAAIRKADNGDENWTSGLIYHPHPDTKPEHFQPPDVLEILARSKIVGTGCGIPVELAVNPEQLGIR